MRDSGQLEDPSPAQQKTRGSRETWSLIRRLNGTMLTSLDFGKVAEVIDMGHQAEVDNIGLITPRIAAGQ